MLMPMPSRAGRALMRRNSACRILFSSAFRPAPPNSLGQSGTVKPRSAIRCIHMPVSGLTWSARRPPPGYSSAGIGVRMLAGQFSSSH